MDFSKVKLVIWDLDDTIWKGTLSEDGAQNLQLDERIYSLLNKMTDCGVVNSVCSKNNKAETIPILRKYGLDELIVFPSIDWTPKGSRIKDLISAMALRPVNVLFVDDNVQNLSEAKFYSDGLMVAEPNIISEMVEYYKAIEPKDKSHKRLKQYRVLEEKHEAASKYESNEDFLFSSNIRVDFHYDCIEKMERLHELTIRSNQLNFTKNRENIEDFRKNIETADDCGYVTVRDNFGDYGIVGFYLIKDFTLLHFLFSCRTIGQGVEQYVYNKLGCPSLDIVGDVYNIVSKDAHCPEWINQEGRIFSQSKKENLPFRILFRGPCDLSSIANYLDTTNIDCEFTYVTDRGNYVEAHLHHTGILNELLPKATRTSLIRQLPFIDNLAFNDKFWSGNYGLIVLSTLPEGGLGIYKRKSDGVKVAFNEYSIPLTESTLWMKFINNELCTAGNVFTIEFLKNFSKEWDFCGRTQVNDYISFLDYFFSHPSNALTHLALILGTEKPYFANEHINYIEREEFHKSFNTKIRVYAKTQSRLHLIEITPFITDQNSFTNNINHYRPEVYFKISQEITKIAMQVVGLEIKTKAKYWIIIENMKAWITNVYSSNSIFYFLSRKLYKALKR